MMIQNLNFSKMNQKINQKLKIFKMSNKKINNLIKA